MLLLGVQVVGVLGYVSSIMNLWLLLVSFIATNVALVTLFPTVWRGKPWCIRSGVWGVSELPCLWFWPCFPCAERDLPYKYAWNKQNVFILVAEMNETSYKILELHLKVNDEQVYKDVFYCALVMWIKMLASLMCNRGISEPGGQASTWALAKCSIYFAF